MLLPTPADCTLVRFAAISLVMIGLCLPLAGCGGGSITEAELRRRAIRRTSDKEEEVAEPPAVVQAHAATPPSAPSPALRIVVGATAPDPTAADEPLEPAENTSHPERPVTEIDRRARSIDNLERIGNALAAYAHKHGRFPPQAVGLSEKPLVSWRVLILPELGYPELYERFALREKWDSPHNRRLLDYIPPEFQSPERMDARTNYLGLAGLDMLFASMEGLKPRAIKDGAANTLAIVEVDDRYAVEWTRPDDHVPPLDLPGDRLGGLRGEGAFGILASGRVVLLPREMPPSRLAALFTVAGGEPIQAAALLGPPTAEPPPPSLATIADDPESAHAPGATEAAGSGAGSDSTQAAAADAASPDAAVALLASSAGYAPDPTKSAVPHDAALAKARELLKELYGKEYEAARTPPQRVQLVKRLLDEAANVEDSPADYYELLRIARDLAASCGDVGQALAACESLEQRFQVDPLPMRIAVLEEANRHLAPSAVDPTLHEARRLLASAIDADRFDAALLAHDLVLKLLRIQGNKAELVRLQPQREAIEAARLLHAAAVQGFAALSADPADAAAQEAVGRYLCLVKNRWEAGLPYLARAADIRLRGLASLELAPDRSLHDTLALADQYWDLAPRFKQPQRRGLQLRAVHHYARLESRLSGSLERARIRRRIDEASALYGLEAIETLVEPALARPTAALAR